MGDFWLFMNQLIWNLWTLFFGISLATLAAGYGRLRDKLRIRYPRHTKWIPAFTAFQIVSVGVIAIVIAASFKVWRDEHVKVVTLESEKSQGLTTDKAKTLDLLREHLEQGRYFEGDLKRNTLVLQGLTKERIQIWQDNIEFLLEDPRHSSYKAIFQDESLTPTVQYLDNTNAEWKAAWKVVAVTNYKLRELIRRIQNQDGSR